MAFTAVSASERRKGNHYVEIYDEFVKQLSILGLGAPPIISGIAYYYIGYRDHALYADEVMVARDAAIHSVLFPYIPFRAADVEQRGDGTTDPRMNKKWRNAFCDRQMFWAHDYAARDIFVISDKNFRRLRGHPEFPNAKISTPQEAAALMSTAG